MTVHFTSTMSQEGYILVLLRICKQYMNGLESIRLNSIGTQETFLLIFDRNTDLDDFIMTLAGNPAGPTAGLPDHVLREEHHPQGASPSRSITFKEHHPQKASPSRSLSA